jgi:hypothetical protein
MKSSFPYLEVTFLDISKWEESSGTSVRSQAPRCPAGQRSGWQRGCRKPTSALTEQFTVWQVEMGCGSCAGRVEIFQPSLAKI